MAPNNYVVIHTDNSKQRRIFVLITSDYGDFVLTKSCKSEGCGCVGCLLFTATVSNAEGQHPILELERKEIIGENLAAYPITEEGSLFLAGLKHKYKKYKGTVTKSKLDKIFRTPDALLFIKQEDDETYTYSYFSPTIEKRVISRGCKSGTCPCVGCHIVDMFYADGISDPVPAVDRESARATANGELILPIYEGEEIISKMLNRDPSIRHDFTPNIFDSPLEKMFYELASLDLHIYTQHKVGKYRLDFAIIDKKIAIELDGHEYHKTKFQRTHDAQRDRWLYGQGWHVLRFTGTEIYKNLDKCIDEICQLTRVEKLTTQPS